ncbi:ketopantoate reductase family protein [Enterococcus sp. BWM-S5]|uniref:Ketopantoate reductase family protein n=1 Tax=Enterococcus larvae TaxID=2794352 RepID=A0ABS4CMT9_9ENTE|nr:ketopantoate reductase family protein [Enterococcus larvae]MBP1047426.1 ketopantoate reductase family protein [Enterococcus larvae]
MKILIYGAGIQGSFLAHSLLKNKKNEVTLLARGQRKADLEAHGLVLSHELQKRKTQDIVPVISTLQPDDWFDLIFVTMKYSDFDSVIEPLAKNRSQTIIFVGNQMNADKLEKAILGLSNFKKNILFGFQNTGGTRKNDEFTVLRFGKGNMKIQSLTGKISTSALLDQVFNKTDYSWKEYTQLNAWLKSHGALIMVMNSLDYIFDNDTKKIRRSKELHYAAGAYKEAFAVLEKNGYPIAPKAQKYFLGRPILAKILLKLLYLTPVMKMAEGNFKEIAAIIEAMNEMKTKTDLSTPNLDALTEAALNRYEKSLA